MPERGFTIRRYTNPRYLYLPLPLIWILQRFSLEFNITIPEPLPIYSEIFMTTVVFLHNTGYK